VSPEPEIDYHALINRTIRDFQPVKRLWRIRTRLFFWILLELAILAVMGAFLGYNFSPTGIDQTRFLLSSGVPILASIAAAFLALKGAVPGRDFSTRALVLLIALICLAIAIPPGNMSGLADKWNAATELLGLAALPWLVLFWAVRRGVPLQPEKNRGRGWVLGLLFRIGDPPSNSVPTGSCKSDHMAECQCSRPCGVFRPSGEIVAGLHWPLAAPHHY